MKKFNSPPPSGSSYSSEYLKSKDAAPQVSALMAKGVSEYRRDIMAGEVERGVFRDGTRSNNNNALTPASNATSIVGLSKTAQIVQGGHGTSQFRGAFGDAIKQIPEVYSPLWLSSNLNLPRDRATVNAWCRAFFALNPFVNNAISLHSTYPISKLNIKCANKKVEKFFNEMIEETGLMNICVQMAQEFFLLGETFVYAEYDENKGKWDRLAIQNPDYIVVHRTVIDSEPVIMLRPDANLQRIVNSNKPNDIAQRKKIPQHIIDAVKRGENIPLPNFNVSHLKRTVSPYDIRGTGLPVSIFRQLMLFDQLRESKFAQASNMINPLTLIKVGGTDGADSLHPTNADLEAFREIFESIQNDKDAKIITHPGVNVERIGWGQGIYDISGDITQLVKEIYVGLEVPPVLMDGGADTTYANGGVALDVLRQRYMQFRNMMSLWLKRKIFAPISHIQGFYNYKEGSGKTEKELIIPEIDWNHMSLFDAGDYTQTLVTLTQPTGDGSPARASNHTLYRSLGLEWEDEQRKIKKELIQAEISKKEKASMEALSLNELRALSDDDEIPEAKGTPDQSADGQGEQPVPGETPTIPPPDLNLPGLSSSPASPVAPTPPPSIPNPTK